MAALNRVIRAAYTPLPIRRLSNLVSDPAAIRVASNRNPSQNTNPCTSMAPPLSKDKLGTRSVQWVFLGCPGVGKGTYASRLSNLLGIPHIATGDLVRDELASSGSLSKKVLCLLRF
jgi:adenylate kinase